MPLEISAAGWKSLTLESKGVEVGVLSDGHQRSVRKVRGTQQRNGSQKATPTDQSLQGESV